MGVLGLALFALVLLRGETGIQEIEEAGVVGPRLRLRHQACPLRFIIAGVNVFQKRLPQFVVLLWLGTLGGASFRVKRAAVPRIQLPVNMAGRG